MTVKLQQIGNSHMLTVPMTIVRQANFKVGDEFEIKLRSDTEDSSQKIEIKKSLKKTKNFADIGAGSFKAKKIISHDEVMKMIKEGAYERHMKHV